MFVIPTHNAVVPEHVPQAQEIAQVTVVDEMKEEAPADKPLLLIPDIMPTPVDTQGFETQLAMADFQPQDSQNHEVDILRSRLDLLEKRVLQQDDDLRRVLATMIDWMDKEGSVETRFQQDNRAA